jgi:hypothetical protein
MMIMDSSELPLTNATLASGERPRELTIALAEAPQALFEYFFTVAAGWSTPMQAYGPGRGSPHAGQDVNASGPC